VPWSNLEAVVGFHFFPSLTNTVSNFKEHANLLTTEIMRSNNRLGGPHQPLLLTDGSSTYQTKKWAWGQSRCNLEHLCARGKCRKGP
jgi:hypothetical protein